MLPLIPILIGVTAGAGGGAILANNKKGKPIKDENKWKYILGGAGLGGLGGAGAGMLMAPGAAGASGAASAATSGAGAASAPIGTAQSAGLFMNPAGQMVSAPIASGSTSASPGLMAMMKQQGQNQLVQALSSRLMNGNADNMQQTEPMQTSQINYQNTVAPTLPIGIPPEMLIRRNYYGY